MCQTVLLVVVITKSHNIDFKNSLLASAILYEVPTNLKNIVISYRTTYTPIRINIGCLMNHSGSVVLLRLLLYWQ